LTREARLGIRQSAALSCVGVVLWRMRDDCEQGK
jgi:hypothetical protein